MCTMVHVYCSASHQSAQAALPLVASRMRRVSQTPAYSMQLQPLKSAESVAAEKDGMGAQSGRRHHRMTQYPHVVPVRQGRLHTGDCWALQHQLNPQQQAWVLRHLTSAQHEGWCLTGLSLNRATCAVLRL